MPYRRDGAWRVTQAHYADWLDGVVMRTAAPTSGPAAMAKIPLRDEWQATVRDLYDLAVVEAFAQLASPSLAYAGAAAHHVAFGGTLYQDLQGSTPVQ